MFLNDPTSALLERALTIRTQKHERLADAIANVDTPGYRPRDIDFLETLNAAVSATGSATQAPSPVEIRGAEAAPTQDGNTVDIDRTMAALAENGQHFSATAKLAQKRLALMRYVASDGMG